MAGVGESAQPGGGLGQQNVEPHFFAGPDGLFHWGRYPHGNFYILHPHGPETGDFIGNNLKTGHVALWVDIAHVFNGIAKYTDHFNSHGGKPIVDVKPLNVSGLFKTLGLDTLDLLCKRFFLDGF